jgi:hypothetical protein
MISKIDLLERVWPFAKESWYGEFVLYKVSSGGFVYYRPKEAEFRFSNGYGRICLGRFLECMTKKERALFDPHLIELVTLVMDEANEDNH